jgi:UPF0716 protein FxsA
MTIGRLALLFIVVPILELVILIRLGQFVGLWPTVALVLGAGFAGAALARLEGTRVFLQFQRELAAGRVPTQAMLDGLSVMVGGAFLLAPGVLTDVAGLMLLFPPTRRWIQRRVLKSIERGMAEGTIRVATMNPQGFGAWGAWTGPQDSDGVDVGEVPRAPSRPTRLDPSKGIVIEPKDD